MSQALGAELQDSLGRDGLTTGEARRHRYRDPMTDRSLVDRWTFVLCGLAVVALVVCVVSTVSAGALAPVFFWSVPEGTEIVTTKEQYESVLVTQLVGRIAAAGTVVLGLGALVLVLVSRRAGRAR